MRNNATARRGSIIALIFCLLAAPLSVFSQGTRIAAPKNKYSPADDVKLGRQAAAQVRQQLPVLPENSPIDAYVERVGQRLSAAIPSEYANRQFQYSFDVVNASDINAFALPGGPMFVNRGMIEAARTDGEMAGVMAHEIAHVALRHGTAQATKQSGAGVQLGAIGGAILGAIIGGNVGGVISQGTQMGLGAYLLKFSREYETQADLLGAQIMARAGYDPRDLANMFRTIEQQGGGRGPEWLSSHPNPGNRFERINEEAARLRVDRSRGSQSEEFSRIKNELQRMPPAPTMQEISNRQQGVSQSRGGRINQGSAGARVSLPSGSFRTYNGGNLFQLAVPTNWRDFAEGSSVTFAPEGAFGDYQGQAVFTHGAIAGLANTGANNLQTASDQYISALLQNNSYLRSRGSYRRVRIDNQSGLMRSFSGRSNFTGRQETVVVYTTMLDNDSLFYLINVVPSEEYNQYQEAFQTMLRSIRLRGGV